MKHKKGLRTHSKLEETKRDDTVCDPGWNLGLEKKKKKAINMTGTNWQNWNMNCSLGNSRVSMLNCLNFILLLD